MHLKTSQQTQVITTSLQRHDVVMMLLLRCVFAGLDFHSRLQSYN